MLRKAAFSAVMLGIILGIGINTRVGAQSYPDTLWIPVTFYDFHSDQSNPEFECNITAGLHKGMVADTLDSDRKPVLGNLPQTPSEGKNRYIKYWFRPWEQGHYTIHAQGDSTVPVYNCIANCADGSVFNDQISYGGTTKLNHDTSFKNIMIRDSLPFEHLANGVYEFKRNKKSNSSFFWLDKYSPPKTFGNEGKNNNFSFTMELHTTFTKNDDIMFRFSGDDDVWAFVDNNLAMDLGGIHGDTADSFNINDVSGLINGRDYTFDLFYAERHTSESNIWITTNILSTKFIDSISIVAEPATATILANDTVTYTGTVWYDSIGADGVPHTKPDPTRSQYIQWNWVSFNGPGDPAKSKLTASSGATTKFTSIAAWETFRVIARYQNPNGTSAIDTSFVTIMPRSAYQLVIEASPDTSTWQKKQTKNPVDTVTLGYVSRSDSVYAIMRDEYGNFYNYSTNTNWHELLISGQPDVISAISKRRTGLGEAEIVRNVVSGLEKVWAIDNTYSKKDTTVVKVLNRAPTANNDSYYTDEDTPKSVGAFEGVLANDTDDPYNPLTVATPRPLTNPPNGTVTLVADGSFLYTPNLNFFGTDTFSYHATDGEFYDTAKVTITVHPVNDPPVAVNDTFTNAEDVILSVTSENSVLNNDTDVDGPLPLTAQLVTNPTHGDISNWSSNGTFTYTPNDNYHGQDSLTYRARDGLNAQSNIATVYITITPVNDLPDAGDDSYVTLENQLLTVPANMGVLSNDTDIDGDILRAVIETYPDPAKGTLNTFAEDGSFSFTPAPYYHGLVTFTYKAYDGTGYSNIATVTIDVGEVNFAPLANPDAYTVAEDNVLTVPGTGKPNVLANDSDPDGDPLTAVLVSPTKYGTLVWNASNNGGFTYTPNLNYHGKDTLRYRAHDGFLSSNVVNVIITITPVNDAPVAVADRFSVNEDDTLTVGAPGVLENDYDVDGDPLTAHFVSGPASGNLTINPDGSLKYVPIANFNGTVYFSYKVHDGAVYSNTVVDTIIVLPVNDAPVAANDAFTTDEDVVLIITEDNSILNNDTDVDGDVLTAHRSSGPKNGTVSNWSSAAGTFRYTPAANFNGKDTISYYASDGKANSNIALIVITVTAVNDTPVAVDDTYETDEDDSLQVTAPGLMDNDYDVDGDALTAYIVATAQPSNGDVTISTSGSFLYTPDPDYHGADSFKYWITDGSLKDTALVTITVRSVNDAPVAQNDFYTTNEDDTLTVSAANGVLKNDTDVDGDVLTAVLVQDIPADKGTLSLAGDGSFTYVPAADFSGSALFTYKAWDGTEYSSVVNVLITVNPVNDPPVARNDSYYGDEGVVLTVNAANGVFKNDYDVDGDPFSATLYADVDQGNFTFDGTDGSFTYDPIIVTPFATSFTYKLWDGTDSSNLATVTIIMKDNLHAPVAVNDTFSIAEDSVLTVIAPGVLENDSDFDMGTLKAILATNVSRGALALDSTTGAFTYTPPANYYGQVTFTYQAKDDDNLLSDPATVYINVTPVNDPPEVRDDQYSINEDTKLSIPAVGKPGVLANDVDIDSDPADLTATLYEDVPANEGTLIFYGSGGFEFMPTLNYFGTVTFTYKAFDGIDSSFDKATVTITVHPINDAPVTRDTAFSVEEDNVLTVPAPGVLGNTYDVEDDPLTAEVVTGVDPATGALSLASDGSFVFTPTADYFGTTTFTYRAHDGSAFSNVSKVTITVNPVNDAPVGVADAYTLDEEDIFTRSAEIGVLANDTDVEGDPLTAVLEGNVSHGALSLNVDGSFTYTPTVDYYGTDSFTYRASDGDLMSEVTTVTLTINPVNDAPVVGDIPNQAIVKGQSFSSFDLDDYVSDVDNTDAEITWTSSTDPNLSVAINPTTHVVTITVVDSLWYGSAVITFTATDPGGLSGSDAAVFTVQAAGTLPSPVTDTLEGQRVASSLAVNLRIPVSQYSGATIYYTYSLDGNQPGNPKTSQNRDSLSGGAGLIDFGSLPDSTHVTIIAFSALYPYENSSNSTFQFFLDYPQLPLVTGAPAPGTYATTDTTVALSVPGHTDATIKYTTNGSDPATDGTTYTSPVALGPFTASDEITIRTYATKPGYKPSVRSLLYTFNPHRLPMPSTVPPGQTFKAESLEVTLHINDPYGVFDDQDVIDGTIDIRYTTDGSAPTTTSNLYNPGEPIVIRDIAGTDSTVLRAVIIKDKAIPGPASHDVYRRSIPSSMKLYPGASAGTPYPVTVTCTAGVALPVFSRIFDQYAARLTEWETSGAPITWLIQVIEGSSKPGTLNTTAGHATSFMPTAAHTTAKIVAAFQNAAGVELKAELTVIILPGAPYRLWIEADHKRTVSPNEPSEVTNVQLSSSKLSQKVYAIVRDSLDNYVTTSKSTGWLPLSNDTAYVIEGQQNLGEGIITRGSKGNGSIVVSATNLDLGLSYPTDSVLVSVLPYWYDSLKIVVNNSIQCPVDSLVMNTNQDSTIFVFGLRDNDHEWEEVDARWEILDPVLEKHIAGASSSAHSYDLSPSDTARGRIRVTLDDDENVMPDTVMVVFTPGPPTRIELDILTPPEERVAGQKIEAVVRLYNDDNKLVRGNLTYSGNNGVIYSDSLGNGGLQYVPTATVDGVRSNLNVLAREDIKVDQSIDGGIDTVSFTLYYAPFDPDSLHTLNVTMSGLDAHARLRLLPGELDSIAIEPLATDTTYGDTVFMKVDNNDAIALVSRGYDQYGNKIGRTNTNWGVTDSLHEISRPNNTSQIFYSSEGIQDDESGYIIATTPDGQITDSIFVTIDGPKADLVNSYTQDLNGNGYLDAIKIVYNKSITLPVFDSDLDIEIFYQEFGMDQVDFVVDSITSPNGTSTDSVFFLHFTEFTEQGLPQTQWTPKLSISGIPNAEDVTNPVTTTDGAGPVIWSVIKQTNAAGDRTKDKVTIKFSEPIQDADGTLYDFSNAPEDVFIVWGVDAETGDTVKVDSLFAGIKSFTIVDQDSLVFFMTNGAELTANHFLSVDSAKAHMADRASTPVPVPLNNQEVRVIVRGAIGQVVVGPNPIMPTFSHSEDELTSHEPLTAFRWVEQDGGGVFATDFVLPSGPDQGGGDVRVKAKMMVFDALGNLVYTRENKNNVVPEQWKNDWQAGTVRQLVFYWNGITDRNRRAAPGVYRTIVFLEYAGQQQKMVGNLGIGR